MSFKDRLDNFFRGRYGYDSLNKFMLVLYAVIILIYVITRIYWFNLAGLVIVILLLLRAFSRNYAGRRKENEKFLVIAAPVTVFFRNLKDSSKTGYKIFLCPQCRQKVRVPKGKGKIEITCPKCRRSFIKRS